MSEKNKKIPKIRFKEFEWEWEEVELWKMLIPWNKVAVKNTKDYKKITIWLNKKWVRYAEILREMADTRPFYVRDKWEIIIWKQNFFNGSIAILPEEFSWTICSNEIMSFKVKNNFSNNFIYEYISRTDFLKKREFLANGTWQKELSEKDFLKFKISLPSIEEQEKIANFLNAIDESIELKEKELEKLKEYKKWIMQQIFTKSNPAGGGIISQLLRFRDKNWNYFPEWKIVKLKEITKIYDWTHMTPNYVNEWIPFYSVENITWNNFFNNLKYLIGTYKAICVVKTTIF